MVKCKKCGNSMWGVEYSYDHPERHKGISEWWCSPAVGGCGSRIGRWSGKELVQGQSERRYGGNPASYYQKKRFK